MIETTLNKIVEGEKVIIKRIELSENSRKRLEEMGVCEDSEVEYMYTSPFNSPTVYRVNDTLLAIREIDAMKIIVMGGAELNEQ